MFTTDPDDNYPDIEGARKLSYKSCGPAFKAYESFISGVNCQINHEAIL